MYIPILYMPATNHSAHNLLTAAFESTSVRLRTSFRQLKSDIQRLAFR